MVLCGLQAENRKLASANEDLSQRLESAQQRLELAVSRSQHASAQPTLLPSSGASAEGTTVALPPSSQVVLLLAAICPVGLCGVFLSFLIVLCGTQQRVLLCRQGMMLLQRRVCRPSDCIFVHSCS